MLKKLVGWLMGGRSKPLLIPRSEHNVSRTKISDNALKVLYRLHKNGYQAYLVGGGIRDLLLEKNPKDFDIVTNALPEQVKDLFSNCRLIGRRFRLAHVHFGRDIIEVATFRKHNAKSILQDESGLILRDNVFGDIKQDVLRRDFTINALYYNIANFSIEDYVGGISDLHNKKIVLIGNPQERFLEDPVRMLRAIRFAAKLDFVIEKTVAKYIHEHAYMLKKVAPARLFEEYLKLFFTGHAAKTFELLQKYNLFNFLFPQYKSTKVNDDLISLALDSTDRRVQSDKKVAPGFLLAVFMWQEVQNEAVDMPYFLAADKVLRRQQKIIAMPRTIVNMARDIIEMQPRLQKKKPAKACARIAALHKFRAGYDFLELRANAGDRQASSFVKQWRKYYTKTTEKA